ncbi:MAG: metal ABC transporter substrate-binding protein, partial [Rubrobacteraceae bacterium]
VGLLIFAAAGCGSVGGGQEVGGKVRVSATITVLQDLVEQVGGDRVEVSTIVPVGGSPETFQPSPSDARKISESRVVFQNGAGLEGWLDDLMQSAGGEDVRGVELARGLEVVDGNPHLWLDVSNAERYVEKIRDALIEADPEGADTYRTNAKEYLAGLEKLDSDIKEQARNIPKERRKLVTFHDAFPYFARAYGFDMVGVILQNPDAEPSGRKVADLVKRVEDEAVPAVFTEPQFNAKLAETIAVEADVEVYELYTDTLQKKESAGSYEALMRTNIDRIEEGLDGR